MRIVTIILLLVLSIPLADSNDRKTRPSEVDCLAKNIYFEARGESFKGKVAVGFVTINRGGNICETVFKHKQFSWTESDREINDFKSYKKSYDIAKDIINNKLKDPTNGSTHFHSGKAPNWVRDFQLIAKIGNHRFYK